MIHKPLFFLQIDIVNIAISIKIWSPQGIQFFDECFFGELIVINIKFLCFLDDFFFGGLLIPIDLFGHKLALIESHSLVLFFVIMVHVNVT